MAKQAVIFCPYHGSGRRGWAGTIVSGVETGSVLSLGLAGCESGNSFSYELTIMVLEEDNI